MADTPRNVYEGLFLFPQSVASNLKDAADHVEELLSKIEAEIISFRKWDERRLSYRVDGHKRGVYFLAYFRAEGGRLASLERDCSLSEQLLRALIVRADHVSPEVIETAEGRIALADEIQVLAERAAAEEGEATTSSVTRQQKSDEEAATPPAKPTKEQAVTPEEPTEEQAPEPATTGDG